MLTHNLIQGSPEWLAYRAQHFNASDAPAMMGCSPYKTREQLLRELHTSMAADVDAATQRLFDNGHRFEALARSLAESIVGEDLYPCVGSEGKFSASFDGLTLGEDVVFEHKSANAELRAVLTGEDAGPALPLHYRVQMEQQLMVSGAGRALFMATLWDGDVCTFSRHCWYHPDEELRAAILRGWEQFDRDLHQYELPPVAPAAPVGKAPETLPALRIEVTGAVTASNLAEFKATAVATIRSVNRELRTDQDFADAEKAVKWCGDVESRIAAAKDHALSQTASIDALFKALDDIKAEAKTVRLDLEKLVTRRKVERKEEAVVAARKELDAHIAALNGELAPMALRPVPVDFAGAIKGLRSFASMDDALAGAVAAGKIAADSMARAMRANIAHFKAHAAGYEMLFADLGQIIHKADDDFCLTVNARIDQHIRAEQAREAARQAAEAQRIAAAEQRAREEEAARIAAQQAESARLEARAVAQRAALQKMEDAGAAIMAAAPKVADYLPPSAPSMPYAAPAALVARPATTAAERATLTLGMICERLQFTVRADFLADVLHVSPARVEGKRPGTYTERQFATICRQLQSHCSAMAELYAGETA